MNTNHFNNNSTIATHTNSIIDNSRKTFTEAITREDESNNINVFDNCKNNDSILLLEKDIMKDLDQRLADSHENILNQNNL